jgi:hypothetical protein
MKGTTSLPSLVLAGYMSFDISLAFPFCVQRDGYGHQIFIAFFASIL